MVKDLPLNEVRKNLSRLLKRVQGERNFSVRITVNGMPAGELRAIGKDRPVLRPGEALIRAAGLVGSPEIENEPDISVAEEHDRYLY
jgi:antitoxin (DNA-binding transcriptional repressor) of toxin-antitoxin stability system